MLYSYEHDGKKKRSTKSMVIVKYENSDDYITNFLIDTLPCDVRRAVYKNHPCDENT